MTITEILNKRFVILGSRERYDLRCVPFSTRGSFMCIVEDQEDRNLYLSISRSPAFMMERKNLVRIVPVVDNKEISFEYSAEPGKMTIKTYRGTAEICFADKKQIRIRGEGISLRFYFKMQMFENCSPKENGDFEIAYEILGKLLFVPLKGAVWCNAKWNCETVQAEDFIIDLIPPVETMRFETAVHEYYSNRMRDNEYVPFDDCVRMAEEDFKKFCKRFGEVPEKYSDMALLAAFTIWTHQIGPEGRLKNSLVYMSRTSSVRAFGYQQCYQAMASGGDIREAWKMLLSMFDYQNEAGQIPFYVSDISMSWLAACAPLHGAALDYVFNMCDSDELKKEDYAGLYGKMSGYAGWLLDKRDRNRSGIPQYYRADECGWIDAKAFKNGRPVQSADLLALTVLLTEYCGRLAIMAGNETEAGKWMNESKRLLAILENEFWDGRKFVSKDAQTGEIVETGVTASLLPVILGKRLREDIVNAIVNRLTSEDECRKDISPISCLLPIGLCNAGKKELAFIIAGRFCDMVCEAVENKADKGKIENKKTKQDFVNGLTSEMAAAFLITVSYVLGEE